MLGLQPRAVWSCVNPHADMRGRAVRICVRMCVEQVTNEGEHRLNLYLQKPSSRPVPGRLRQAPPQERSS